MKIHILIPLTIALFPLSTFAKWNIPGTPDVNENGGTGNGHGDLQRAKTYEFGLTSKDYSDSLVTGVSSKMGEWWVASSSGTPWDTFNDDSTTDTQPSFHITEDLHAGDEFLVGLSVAHQISDYTSEFRMTNDIIGVGTQIYFGLRNVTDPSVLATHTAATAASAAQVDGVTLVDGDPIFGTKGHIAEHQSLLFKGHSTGLSNLNHVPVTEDLDAMMFEWVHFETDSIDQDITFTIKKQDTSVPVLELTEWVAYIVMADTASTVVGEEWGDTPPSSADAIDDVVFSWTVHGRSGYALDPTTGDPLENPTYDDPNTGIFRYVPEPSSSLLLGLSLVSFTFRRKR